MRKKNIIGFLLAFVMLFSICTNSFVVFAEESGDAKEPAVENKIAGAEIVDNEKEFDEEKIEDPQEEEIVKESEEADKKIEKVQENKETAKTEEKNAEELRAKDSEEAIDLGEEKVPEPVGVPADFDLATINTIAKDNAGNYYGVKTYGNSYGDTDIFKTYYKITEAQYNEVAKSCFMVFKRADGEPFKLQGVKISTSHIDDDNLKDGVTAGPIFTEIQFKHHMAYRLGFLLNNSPLKVDGQEELTWSITLKKDWVIERCPDFSDNSSPDYAYVNYNVEIDGGGHKIYRKDDGVTGILQLGSGMSGQNVPVRTAKIKDLTIEGNNKYYGIELSQKGRLNLENVKIENCYADKNHYYYGGAIKLNDGAQLTMDADTSISNCKANIGGAIRLLDNCSLTINGSTFTNNQADLGGAICALKKNCKINIKDATFDGNKAVKTIDGKYLQGGAIYTNSPLNISDTTFMNNNSDKNGGAIISYADTTISRCNFTENSSAEGNGGAVYHGEGKLTIDKNTFTKNNAKNSGGAIYALESATIDNSTFSENKAKWGGAIANFSDLSINNATFNKNEATSTGGAIYTGEGITVEESSLVENKANKGGAIYISKGESEIKNTSFTKNQSLNSGGAIYINHYNKGTTKISGTRFTENMAKAYGGGAFLGIEGKLEVSGSKFSENQAAYGAGISSYINVNFNFDTNLTNIKVDSSEFTDNLSLMGAGICTAFPTEINNSTFNKNTAIVHPKDDQNNPHDSGVGGAIEIIDNKITIKASTFEENWAYGSGGAIGINGVARDKVKNITSIKPNIKVEISDGTKFIGNICNVGQGGAIFTIPYLYDIEGYETGVDKETLKAKAYRNLSTANDTLFKDNLALSGFVDPPENYTKYTNLAFARNSFTDVLPSEDVAKSLLNNYDVNYKNKKLSAFFDPNGGEFTEGKNPKDIRVIKDEKDKEIKLLAAPKRDGYKFTGWKLSMNIPKDKLNEIPEETLKLLKEGKIFKAGDNFKLDADYIFVAQWEKDDTPASPSKPEPKPETKPEPEPEIKFKKHEYVETFPVITKLAEKDNIYSHIRYLFGYPDDTIKPEGNMTRAEAVAVVTRLEGYSFKDDSEKIFKDLKKGAWYNKYINAAFEKGILVEKEGQAFRPDEAITRAEFAKLISFIDADNSKIAPFPDVKGHVYEDAINKAYGNDRIKGYPDGSFRPDAKITRAEIVTILNNFYDRKADDKSLENVENIKMLKHFKDLKEDYWAYYEITEAANSHKFTRRSKGLAENWVHLIEDLEK